MFARLCFIVLIVSVWQSSGLPSRAKRQGFSWGDIDDTDTNTNTNTDFEARPRPRPTPRPPTPSTTSAAGTTTTTPSPEYAACVKQCPITPQYNPICGSNRVTYNNESHLKCARQCGLSVRAVFGGTCRAL